MTSRIERQISFLSEGLRIQAALILPARAAPCVLMSHGLESTGDGDDYPNLAQLLANEGIASLRITHRGCGISPDASESKDASASLSGRIADLQDALDFLSTVNVDMGRLGAIGTSFGGMVVLGITRYLLQALVLVATPYTIASPRHLVGTESLPMDSYPMHGEQAVHSQIHRCPILIIHGDRDTTVPVGNAHALYNRARKPKRLEIIEDSGHLFSKPQDRKHVTELSLEWFRSHLLPSKMRSTSRA